MTGYARQSWSGSAVRLLAGAAIALIIAAQGGHAEADPVGEDDDSFHARYAAIEPLPASTAPADLPPSGPFARPVHASAGAGPPIRGGDTPATYQAMVVREAEQQGLAPAIAEAVMAVESGFNPDVIGGAGEIGLMQIMPSTARMLGFLGSNAELAVPETNIHYGVTYLAQAWRLAGGDLCTATMKYRAGHGETRFSYLSVAYCVAVRGKLFARGYPVTRSVPVATFGEPGASGGGCGRKCLRVAQVGRVDLSALNSRLSSLVIQVHAGR